MGLDVKEASLHLDHKLLHLMDQLEDLEKKREKLNSLIEEGWFSISKARYSMGNKQVSALQYASEMVPLVRVHTKILSSGEAEFQTQREEFRDEDTNYVPVEDIGPEEKVAMPREGLRRRGTNKQSELKKDVSSGQQEETSHKSKTDRTEHQDPLKWFGILVPQNLKQAQSSFKQVIELAAEIAAIQSAVLASRAELQDLEDEHSGAHAEEAFFHQVLPQYDAAKGYVVTWYTSSSPCAACAAKIVDVLRNRKTLRLTIFCSRLFLWEEPEIQEGLKALAAAGCKLRMMKPLDFTYTWDTFVENEEQTFAPWEDCQENYEYYDERLSNILQ